MEIRCIESCNLWGRARYCVSDWARRACLAAGVALFFVVVALFVVPLPPPPP